MVILLINTRLQIVTYVNCNYCMLIEIPLMSGRGSFANLVNEHNFVKLKLSKHHMHMQYCIYYLDCTICQIFFAKTFINSIFKYGIVTIMLLRDYRIIDNYYFIHIYLIYGK